MNGNDEVLVKDEEGYQPGATSTSANYDESISTWPFKRRLSLIEKDGHT